MKLVHRLLALLPSTALIVFTSARVVAQTPPTAAPAPATSAADPAAGQAPVAEPAAADPAPADPAPAASSAASDPGTPLPAEGLPLPVYVPPPEPTDEAKAPAATPTTPGAPTVVRDEIKYSGYLPGYRRHFSFGEGPDSPAVEARPGLLTPGFGAPVPPNEWQFSFNGFMSVSAQLGINRRVQPEPDQSTIVTHVPPLTLDYYMHFTSTNSVPGNWVNLRFKYGNSRVSVNFSVDSYNPTVPTTYYQMGSQFFINNAFLSYTPAPLGKLSFQIDAGRMGISHGQLSRYGNGLYTNLIAGLIQGNGLRAQAFYDLNPEFKFVGEWDLMATPDGTLPASTVRNQENGWRRALWAGSFMHGLHVGFNAGKDTQYEFRIRYMGNHAYEDRLAPGAFDDPTTRVINEQHLPDGSMDIFATDFKMLDNVFGVLGVGASLTSTKNVFPLRGLVSYGGNGEEITERFLGINSEGTGKVAAIGTNYMVNFRPLLNRFTGKFEGTGPDVALNLAAQYAHTSTDGQGFDGRARYKYGADVAVQLSKYFGFGVRGDQVIPSSSDPGQTFEVLAPRLQFKTDWYSREALQILFVKWFFGPHTRKEGTGENIQTQLDDMLFAINLNMWW